MIQPIFVSATTGDLGEARDIVVGVLAAMGYRTRVQPTLPFTGGDLRVELRRLVDECASVIQLVGFRCGRIPATDDPVFGRVSHTQYEALYAERQGKRVLYITPPHNYPFTSCEPEPPELVELQLRYREAIRSRGDQRGTPANPDALRVLIYQMRDDLAAMLKLGADRHAELMQGLAATPAAVGEYLRDSGLVAESPARARLPARIEGRDGAEMVLVAGGPFLYGSTQHDWLASDDEKPQRTLTLPDFYIDRLPVTNRLYAKFLDQTRPSPETAAAWIDLSATRPRSRLRRQGEGYQVLPGYEEHPVTGVSWHGAKAYADWAGKRLPSEQEWEKAARGTDGRNRPWGNRWIDEQCNVDRRVGNTTPVGAYGNSPSPCGCFDMAGNVWQWTRSIISHAPGEADDRVIRGGCWRNTSTNARCASRGSWRMTHRDDHIGFRCVIDAPEPQAAPSRQAP